MSVLEKNLVSHRGQVIHQIKYFLQRQYGLKQLIVPLGIVVRDRKLLLLKRRDPRPEFNNKWEFPGGGVENEEAVEACLLREIKEETGYRIKIIERLPRIYTSVNLKNNYQVFLPCYVCAITTGELQTTDAETADFRWCTYAQLMKMNLFPLNKKIIKNNNNLLKQYID